MLPYILKDCEMIKQSKLEKPEQKRGKNLITLVIMLKSFKKLKMLTITIFKKLKELCGRDFCKTKIKKLFFRTKIDVEL